MVLINVHHLHSAAICHTPWFLTRKILFFRLSIPGLFLIRGISLEMSAREHLLGSVGTSHQRSCGHSLKLQGTGLFSPGFKGLR